ncbi:MAG: type II toxin-antitoxin system RelE/ParE family toxin [Azospirillaceae bacterium]
MLQAFRRAAQRGPRHVPGTKPLTGRDGLFEFRRGQLRVLWFYDQDRVVICSHGFVKKSGKAPPRELDRAEASRDRYFAAKQRRELVFED